MDWVRQISGALLVLLILLDVPIVYNFVQDMAKPPCDFVDGDAPSWETECA